MDGWGGDDGGFVGGRSDARVRRDGKAGARKGGALGGLLSDGYVGGTV